MIQFNMNLGLNQQSGAYGPPPPPPFGEGPPPGMPPGPPPDGTQFGPECQGQHHRHHKHHGPPPPPPGLENLLQGLTNNF